MKADDYNNHSMWFSTRLSGLNYSKNATNKNCVFAGSQSNASTMVITTFMLPVKILLTAERGDNRTFIAHCTHQIKPTSLQMSRARLIFSIPVSLYLFLSMLLMPVFREILIAHICALLFFPLWVIETLIMQLNP